MVWCDDSSAIVKDIHLPFKLSSSGGDIGIYYKDASTITIDELTYKSGEVPSGYSNRRKPDGSNNWGSSSNPTPGTSNE
jgi:hypothetical protein